MSAFKGVWIPAALMQRTDLTLQERVILGYCASFSGPCIASNAHIAKNTGIPEKTVRNSLTSLRAKGVLSGRKFPTADFYTLSPIGTSVSLIGAHREKGEHKEQRGDVPNRDKPFSLADVSNDDFSLYRRFYDEYTTGDELRRRLAECRRRAEADKAAALKAASA